MWRYFIYGDNPRRLSDVFRMPANGGSIRDQQSKDVYKFFPDGSWMPGFGGTLMFAGMEGEFSEKSDEVDEPAAIERMAKIVKRAQEAAARGEQY